MSRRLPASRGPGRWASRSTGRPGRWNAITDVPGVEVGYTDADRGRSVRTGVTAIHPRGAGGADDPVPRGLVLPERQRGDDRHRLDRRVRHVRRAGGDHQHPRGRHRAHGVVAWRRQHHPAGRGLAAAGGGRDLGRLPQRHQRRRTSPSSLPGRAGVRGPRRPGRGGLGRRRHRDELLRVQGRLGHRLPARARTAGRHARSACSCRPTSAPGGSSRSRACRLGGCWRETTRWRESLAPPGAGSVIAIVATDAPLLPDQCQALARRVTLGLARTGTTGSHFSGDLFLAFSTGNPGAITSGAAALQPGPPAAYDQLRFIPWGAHGPVLRGRGAGHRGGRGSTRWWPTRT